MQNGADETWPLVVVGAGAAGLTAASFAARAGVRTLVLETRPRPGAKIRVSGGGRCNVLPSVAGPEDFFTHGNSALVRHVLRTWPLGEVRRYFEDALGVALKLEPSGKLFPVSDQSREVVEALLAALVASGAQLRAGQPVRKVVPPPRLHPTCFVLQLACGSQVLAERVLLATGGLSMPKTGSDGSGWGFARALGHSVWPTAPALVPLLGEDGGGAVAEGTDLRQLSGLSLPVVLRARAADGRTTQCRGDFLFTHRGYSGPCVLDVSRTLTEATGPVALSAQFLHPTLGAEAARAQLTVELGNAKGDVGPWLRQRLPRRLVEVLCARTGLGEALRDARACALPRPARRMLVDQLVACLLPVTGSEGYKTAEVTSGGVPLAEVHCATLESRLQPGLYFAGETLDVTGRLGGFNFLWAWVTGRLAGEAAARAGRLASAA